MKCPEYLLVLLVLTGSLASGVLDQTKEARAAVEKSSSNEELKFADPSPQLYNLTARASTLDSAARPHPEINFLFEKDGKPQDIQHASVDTRVTPQGKLVVWLMGHNSQLFDRVSGYGLPVELTTRSGDDEQTILLPRWVDGAECCDRAVSSHAPRCSYHNTQGLRVSTSLYFA